MAILGFHALVFTLLANSIHSLRSLLHLVPLNAIPRPVLKMLEWFRLIEAAT
jgi:hypothetical protein